MSVSGDVSYRLSAFKRAGFVGGGQHLLLQTEEDPAAALAAYAEAILDANEAMEARIAGEVFGTVNGPVPTPQGPMAYVAECEPARALPMLLDLVVEGLERRGISGRLSPGHVFAHPVFDWQSFPCLGMIVSPTFDVEAHLRACGERIVIGQGTWVSEPPDAALLGALVRWTLAVPGPVTVGVGATQVEVTSDPEAVTGLLTSTIPHASQVTVSRTPSDHGRRACAFSPGGVVVVSFDPEVPREEHLHELLGLATDLASAASSALVREMSTGSSDLHGVCAFAPVMPLRRAVGSTVVRHLEGDFVYDAGVGQLLTASHLDKTHLPAERWQVDRVGRDRFTVVHRDPERWFNPGSELPTDGPQGDIPVDVDAVETARTDFADAILTPAVVLEHSPHLSPAHREVVASWLARVT